MISLKTKIWLTVLAIVLMFSFFTLIYFPAQQGELLLKNYSSEVENLANTVALGVKIAITEQDFENVQTAMEFVKDDPRLKFVSMIQNDTSWNKEHDKYAIRPTVFKTFPENVFVNPLITSNDSLIIKRSSFSTPGMSGTILLAFTTKQINESKKKIREASLLVSGGIFLVGILIGFWLARNISRSVMALRNAAIRVGKGDMTQRVENFSGDEIGELARAFNKMVDDLSLARKELNESNTSLSESNKTLNDTLIELKSAQAQLIHSEKMASLGELTAGIAHEIQNPLNFVNNFSEVSSELVSELTDELKSGNVDSAIQVASDLDMNLKKITHHGKRADAIVKGMLQHSRTSSGSTSQTDINALVDEYLRLSYHGLRAKDKSFNSAMDTSYDPQLEKIETVAQDIGRVILNLFTNAFYSVMAKKKLLGENYKPLVSVVTRNAGEKVEIRVRDNGLGIPKKVVDKIFQPFFTTKPTGEGTGLGLSLSYDIIKAHGGEIKLETQEGEYAEFTIYLPVKNSLTKN